MLRDKEKIQALFKEILTELEIDLSVGDLINTPERMARTWLELTRSYELPVGPKIVTYPAEAIQVLGIHGLHYFALCEHHGLPFEGSVCVLYVPDKKIIGLSKPARIVDYYSHMLMIQERFTQQILQAIKEAVEPLALYVVVRGRHLCSAMRGVESREHEFITEQMHFKNKVAQSIWEKRLRDAEKLCQESRR